MSGSEHEVQGAFMLILSGQLGFELFEGLGLVMGSKSLVWVKFSSVQRRIMNLNFMK